MRTATRPQPSQARRPRPEDCPNGPTHIARRCPCAPHGQAAGQSADRTATGLSARCGSPERPPAATRDRGLNLLDRLRRALIRQDRRQSPPFFAFLVQTATKIGNLFGTIRQKRLLRLDPFAQDQNLMQQSVIGAYGGALLRCCVSLHFRILQVLHRNWEHAMQFRRFDAPSAIISLGC